MHIFQYTANNAKATKHILSAIHSPKPVIKHVERCLRARFANVVCSETFCSRAIILLLPVLFSLNSSLYSHDEASCNHKHCLQTTCKKKRRKTQEGCCWMQPPNRDAKRCWLKQVQSSDDLLGMWKAAPQFGSGSS